MASAYLHDRWVEEMTTALTLSNPDKDPSDIRKFVEKKYKERYTEHAVQIYNSYENITYDTLLGETLDWIQSFKPLIAESGVFFYPKHMKRNLNTEIIKDCMLDARTIHKAEMFAALEAGDSFLASTKDIQQANDKKAANSGYGAEGQRSSFLFNMHSAMSVTSCGRGQLSTVSQCIENLLADYMKFFNMDEFFTWINHIIAEKNEWEFDTFKIINRIPSRKEYVNRFISKFLHHTFADTNKIEALYDSLDDEMRVRTYYKANIHEFFRNCVPQRLVGDIATTKCEFINPNKAPDEIADDLKYLTQLVMEFVNYRYGIFRYEDRMRYQKRSVIPVSDTDSLFICYHNIACYLEDNIIPMTLHKKGDTNKKKQFHMKVVNIMSFIMATGIRQTLDHYLGKVHVAEEDWKYINMKNEFHYARVIVTHAKKSYVGWLLRKESHVLAKPKLDVKGVNFFKSTASKRTSDFIYDEILVNQLLEPKDGKVSLKRTYRAIHDFQQQIAEDIRRGDMGFLKRSIKVKSPDAYVNPMRIGAYKAVWVWNYINGDRNRIDLPATTTQVKVLLKTKKDAAKLEKWPEVYKKVIELFDTNSDIGDYMEVDKKTGKEKLIRGKGIKTIALPDDMDEVPDWILAIIDVETLVANNTSLFTQLYRPLGMSKGESSHNGASVKYYTNVVRI